MDYSSVGSALLVVFLLPCSAAGGCVDRVDPQVPDSSSLATRTALGELEGPYYVDHVIDGDTVLVRTEEAVETVRLIGIDAPEVDGPYTEAECYGDEASREAREFLAGRTVRLEGDPSQGATDRFGRRLAYLWTDDGLLVNLWLVQEGLAYEYTYDRSAPYRYAKEFGAAERAARGADEGLWAVCARD